MSSPEEPENIMNKTILVVDDEVNILHTLKRQLRSEGYNILTADSAEKGLEILEQQPVSVIISDQRMPNMKGSEFLQKAIKLSPNAIRMILSGYTDFSAISDAVNKGAIYRVISKPWKEEVLVHDVEDAFDCYAMQVRQAQAGRIIDNALEAVLVTDEFGNVLSVNTTFTLLTEYDKEDNIKGIISIIDTDMEGQAKAAEIERLLQDYNGWQGEIWLKKKSGISFLAYLSITAIKDQYGHIQQYTYTFFEINSHEKATSHLEGIKYYDDLTELPNRKYLTEHLESKILQSEKTGLSIAIFLIDLDHFKHINDVLGKEISDSLLKTVTDLLNDRFKGKDFIARIKNDEFAIVVCDDKKSISLSNYINEIGNIFNGPLNIHGHEINVAPSIGISIFPADGNNAVNLINNACVAVNTAKSDPGSNYCFYDSSKYIDRQVDIIHEQLIQEAIEKEEFILQYQPILYGKNNKISCIEPFVYWQNDDFGLLRHELIYPIITRNKLAFPVEKWMLQQSVSEVKSIIKKINKEINLVLKLSDDMLYHKNLIEILTDSLAQYKFSKANLIIKISENSAVDFGCFENVVREINNFGVKMILTDFTMENLSLYNIIQLPFSYIEMDHTLVDELNSNQNTDTLVITILNLIRDIKKKSICGNINNKTQFNMLRKYKCDLVQGNYLKNSLNMSDLEIFLKKHIK